MLDISIYFAFMKAIRILLFLLLGLIASVFAILAILFIPFLYKGWVVYPQLDKEVAALQELRKETPRFIETACNRGAFHMHTWWSHDSRGTVEEITTAANEAGYKFLFLTDHAHSDRDSFPRGIVGMHNGILIEPGTERNGFCCWPLRETVVDWSQPVDTVAKVVVEGGGMIYYLHTENEHNWENTHYQGMEIYNWHTDILESKLGLVLMGVDFIVNKTNYRHWCYYQPFDVQTAILANWDRINRQRKVVGIAGQDVHENQNIRARWDEQGRVEWVGFNAKTIAHREPNLFDRLFLPPTNEEGNWAFRYMVDTYLTTFNHCANYLFVDTISVDAIKEAANNGHLFVAFKSLGDAMGFQYFAQKNDSVTAILGDSVSLENVSALRAVSPLPAKFILKRNGDVVEEQESCYDYSFHPQETGNYRLELHFKLLDAWYPWIYTNNIYVY